MEKKIKSYEYNPEVIAESTKYNTDPSALSAPVLNHSPDQAMETTGNRLVSIFYKQYERRCLILMLRAFKRWCFEYPLAMKCDELMRQLKERNSALETVRSSYLKDVISVKHHLNVISKIPEQRLDKIKEEVYELHAVPSADIRSIIETAKQGWNETSSQLRETLIDAGIVDPFTIRTLNSWEQSRSYKRMMRVQRGPSYQFPDAGGESVSLAAPSTHRLFVRYCQDCIGLMMFVKNWNLEVEASMKFKADYGQIDEKINEFKKLIKSLQDLVASKEEEVISLTAKIGELEEANAWFEKWSGIKDREAQEAHKQEQHRIHTNLLAMAEADKESLLYNMYLRNKEQLNDMFEREMELQSLLQRERLDRDMEVEARLKLATELQRLQFDKNTLIKENDHLRHIQAQYDDERRDYERKIFHLQQTQEELMKALENKDKQMEAFRNESSDRINDLVNQLQVLTSDFKQKEQESDTLREEVRQKKQIIAKQSAEMNRLHERIETLQAELKVFLDREQLKTIKKFKLKVVARAILSLVQFFHRLKNKNYVAMGLIGYKVLLRQQQHQLDSINEQLQESQSLYAHQQRMLQKLERENERFSAQIKDLKNLNESRDKELKDLKASYYRQQQELREMKNDRDSIMQQLHVLKEETSNSAFLQNSMNLTMQRVRIFVHLQRNLSAQLSQLLWKTRFQLQTYDLEGTSQLWSKQKRVVENMENGMWPTNEEGSFSITSATVGSADNASPTNAGRPTSSKKRKTKLTVSTKSAKKLTIQDMKGFVMRQILWYRGQRGLFIMQPKLSYVEWMKWIRGENIDPLTGELKGINDEHILKIRIYNYYKDELRQVQYIQDSVRSEMRQLDDFFGLIHQCFVSWKEKLEHYHELEAAYRELLDKRKRGGTKAYVSSDRSVTSKGSDINRERRTQLMKMKSSFNHLLDQDVSTYLANILGAIESVQLEHGEVFEDGQGDNPAPTNEATAAETSVKRSSSISNLNSTSNSGSRKTTINTGAPVSEQPNATQPSPPLETPPMLVKDKKSLSRLQKMKSQKFIPEHESVAEEHPTDDHEEHEEGISAKSDGMLSSNQSSAKQSSFVEERNTANRQPLANFDKENEYVVDNPSDQLLTREVSEKITTHSRPEPIKIHTESLQASTVVEQPENVIESNEMSIAPPDSIGFSEESSPLPSTIVETTPVLVEEGRNSLERSRQDFLEDTSSKNYQSEMSEPSIGFRDSLISTRSNNSSFSNAGLDIDPGLISEDRQEMEQYPTFIPHNGMGNSFSSTTSNEAPPPSQLVKQQSQGTQHISKDGKGEADDEEDEDEDNGNNSGDEYESPNLRLDVDPIPPDEDLDDDFDDDDEENSFHAELEMMKKEATKFLAHDTVLREEITTLKTENATLTGISSQLESELQVLRSEYEALREEQHQIRYDLARYMSEHDKLNHENELLREMVEDGYRFHNGEKAEIINLVKRHIEDEEKQRIARKATRKDQGTQITCSVCAIRDFQHHHPHVLDSSTADDQSVVDVHPGLAKALGEDIVLVARARPRTIDTIRKTSSNIPIDYERQSYEALMQKLMKFADDVLIAKEAEQNIEKDISNRTSRKNSEQSSFFVDQVLDVIEAQKANNTNTNQRPSSPTLKESVKIPQPPGDRKSSLDSSLPQTGNLEISKYPYASNPNLNLSAINGDEQVGHEVKKVISQEALEKNKNMFDYAKNFLRPQSAVQRPTSAANAKIRPKSSYAQSSNNKVNDPAKDKLLISSQSANQLVDKGKSAAVLNDPMSNNNSTASSKFRKLKQIPTSNSVTNISEGSTATNNSRAQLLIKNLLTTQQDQRTITHTAAFIQGPYLHASSSDIHLNNNTQRSLSAKLPSKAASSAIRNHGVAYYNDEMSDED